MTDRDTFDAERREMALCLVAGIEPSIEDSEDASRAAGALLLAATLVGVKHGLGDVRQLITADLERDLEAIRSGEWEPGGNDGR